MQTEDIRQLAEWLAATDIDLLELRGPGINVEIHRGGAVVPDVPAAAQLQSAPAAQSQVPVRASSPGVLLDRIPGRAAPLCAPGAAVLAGDLLALLQIGPLLLPVHAPCEGWAGDWLVPAGATVGYGTPLLNIDTEPAAAADAQA